MAAAQLVGSLSLSVVVAPSIQRLCRRINVAGEDVHERRLARAGRAHHRGEVAARVSMETPRSASTAVSGAVAAREPGRGDAAREYQRRVGVGGASAAFHVRGMLWSRSLRVAPPTLQARRCPVASAEVAIRQCRPREDDLGVVRGPVRRSLRRWLPSQRETAAASLGYVFDAAVVVAIVLTQAQVWTRDIRTGSCRDGVPLGRCLHLSPRGPVSRPGRLRRRRDLLHAARSGRRLRRLRCSSSCCVLGVRLALNLRQGRWRQLGAARRLDGHPPLGSRSPGALAQLPARRCLRALGRSGAAGRADRGSREERADRTREVARGFGRNRITRELHVLAVSVMTVRAAPSAGG